MMSSPDSEHDKSSHPKSPQSDSGQSALGKNTAEAKKTYRRILFEEIREGLEQHKRQSLGLFLSAVSGGLDIGFSLFLIAVVMTITRGQPTTIWTELLGAGMYAVGFIFVVIGRSELFTEHTALAVLPVLDGKASFGSLMRLWGIVYIGNLLGTVVFANVAVVVGPDIHVIEPKVFGEIARRAYEHSAMAILFSAILAGWLMGLLSWLVTAARDTISQIVIVLIVTSAIGLSHLHHSIVGSTEVLAGLFARQGVAAMDFFHFLLWTTLGNAIGGIVFVALLKYSHASRGQQR